MIPFWILPLAVCVEAPTAEEALGIAESETGKKATEAKELPYPAEPRVGSQSNCPSFCWQPTLCAGRRSCPRSYACSE